MRYCEISLPENWDTATALEMAGGFCQRQPFGDFVLYEQENVWHYAGGTACRITVTGREVRARWQGGGRTLPWADSPIPALAAVFETVPFPWWEAFGWAFFELAHLLPGLSAPPRQNAAGQPVIQLVIPHIHITVSTGGAVIRSVSRTDALRALDLLAPASTGRAAVPAPVDTSMGRADYCAAVETAVAEIKRGAFQKIILSRRLPLGYPVDLAQTYLLGRRAQAPARSFLVNLNGLSAAGFSPETVAEVDSGGRVVTRPLAGTRALGGRDQEARLRAELLSDPKEIYEHAI